MCTCALKPENRPSHFQIGPLRVETGHYPTEAASLHLKRLRQKFYEWQYVQRSPGLIRYHERLGDSAFSALDSVRQKLPSRQQGHPLCFRSIPQVRAFGITYQFSPIQDGNKNDPWRPPLGQSSRSRSLRLSKRKRPPTEAARLVQRPPVASNVLR
jgi:hypothetical protein